MEKNNIEMIYISKGLDQLAKSPNANFKSGDHLIVSDEKETCTKSKEIQIILKKEDQIVESYLKNLYTDIKRSESIIYLKEVKKILDDWNIKEK